MTMINYYNIPGTNSLTAAEVIIPLTKVNPLIRQPYISIHVCDSACLSHLIDITEYIFMIEDINACSQINTDVFGYGYHIASDNHQCDGMCGLSQGH